MAEATRQSNRRSDDADGIFDGVWLTKEIVIIDGLDEVIRQQKGIGRNLNQLTTLANMGKVNTVYLQELADAYAQVSSLLSDILKRRRWS